MKYQKINEKIEMYDGRTIEHDSETQKSMRDKFEGLYLEVKLKIHGTIGLCELKRHRDFKSGKISDLNLRREEEISYTVHT
uniref:Uncharacterized protein n=1 Tax=Romanomermis culicivorax TaxID=13658 RepID=A0A915KGL7_ROMCU